MPLRCAVPSRVVAGARVSPPRLRWAREPQRSGRRAGRFSGRRPSSPTPRELAEQLLALLPGHSGGRFDGVVDAEPIALAVLHNLDAELLALGVHVPCTGGPVRRPSAGSVADVLRIGGEPQVRDLNACPVPALVVDLPSWGDLPVLLLPGVAMGAGPLPVDRESPVTVGVGRPGPDQAVAPAFGAGVERGGGV